MCSSDLHARILERPTTICQRGILDKKLTKQHTSDTIQHMKTPDAGKRYALGALIPFVMLHAACALAFFQPLTPGLLALAASTYALRVLAITCGYHRYFSHRSFRIGRAGQFALAFLAQTSAQKGALWWAAKHRQHHRYSDADGDVHSPVRSGFWWAHVGWIVSDKHDAYDPRLIADFQKFPELVWLNRHHWIPAATLGTLLYALGGWPADRKSTRLNSSH